MPALLDPSEITAALTDLPGWEHADGALRLSTELASFPSAVAVVAAVADAAEARDHHPDIDIRYRTLVFTLSTHSEGGITALDVELAGEISRLVARAGG